MPGPNSSTRRPSVGCGCVRLASACMKRLFSPLAKASSHIACWQPVVGNAGQRAGVVSKTGAPQARCASPFEGCPQKNKLALSLVLLYYCFRLNERGKNSTLKKNPKHPRNPIALRVRKQQVDKAICLCQFRSLTGAHRALKIDLSTCVSIVARC